MGLEQKHTKPILGPMVPLKPVLSLIYGVILPHPANLAAEPGARSRGSGMGRRVSSRGSLGPTPAGPMDEFLLPSPRRRPDSGPEV